METLDSKIIRYINVDTMANPDSDTTPSNPGIETLAQMLLDELNSCSIIKQAGIYTNNGGYFVCAKIMPNQTDVDIPIIGFIAHMDTSYRYPGTPNPVIVNGIGTLVNKYGIDLRKSAFTEQEFTEWIAKGVLVSDNPFTILGVKDKAGIAEIMGMIEYLQENPYIPHGQINICFTADAELGKSIDHIEDQGTIVQVTNDDGIPLWMDPSTGNTTTIFSPGLKPVNRLDGGFMDADFAYMVDSPAQTHVQYNNFNISEMEITFIGERVQGGFDEDAVVNSIKNACLYVSKVLETNSALTVDSGNGFVFIKSLEGDYLKAILKMTIKDLDYDNVVAMMDELEFILQKMPFYNKDGVTVKRTDLYNNVKSKIPYSVIGLATKGNFDLYNRGCITLPMNNGYAAAALTNKGVPTVSLSCGGYNFYTYKECIPLPALDNCREVLVNIVKESYTYDFNDDFD